MLFTTLTTVLTSAALVAAAPTTNAPTGTLERRSCTTQYPTNLFQVIEDSPNFNTGNHGYVYTAQGAGKTSRWISELQFTNVPANAYGCSVEFFFSHGQRVDNFGDGTRLEFFKADRDISLTDTWVNRPAKLFSVGTQVVSSSPTADTKLTTVTGSCAQTLNYLIEVQGDKAGSVGFFQGNGNGIRLTYNC
ncbi:hypothetical protein CAC42_3149 [Sphaceloma murrayae]|uniref:Ubiquitin 3 binding protein But2 C-terminal domain-containing protein n=1 Tax=Sphaceloma murrayae TaxID=2082308 RepID=A0A2K1QRP9_9PEZI|nr:hypothetical protein CAC42_3149 [Sphaceloma murrayae]